jgi:hypothetical protein
MIRKMWKLSCFASSSSFGIRGLEHIYVLNLTNLFLVSRTPKLIYNYHCSLRSEIAVVRTTLVHF